MPRAHYSFFGNKCEACERKFSKANNLMRHHCTSLGAQGSDVKRRVVSCTRIVSNSVKELTSWPATHTGGGAQTCKTESISRRRPGHCRDPAVRVQLAVGLTELQRLAEMAGVRRGVHHRVEGAVHATLEVGRASGQQLPVVRMKGAAEHRTLELLLQVLADPPIVGLFVCADRHTLGARGHGEPHAIQGPLDVEGSAVNSEDHQSRHPLRRGGVESPHECVAVVRTRHDLVVHR
mmetsp:Transcript_19160/g.32073  ORF Transcript_19160/g.32073 Transcript_19160/m.32073 type:complete len:235 (-) Transcript_19160:239-943(-)